MYDAKIQRAKRNSEFRFDFRFLSSLGCDISNIAHSSQCVVPKTAARCNYFSHMLKQVSTYDTSYFHVFDFRILLFKFIYLFSKHCQNGSIIVGDILRYSVQSQKHPQDVISIGSLKAFIIIMVSYQTQFSTTYIINMKQRCASAWTWIVPIYKYRREQAWFPHVLQL